MRETAPDRPADTAPSAAAGGCPFALGRRNLLRGFGGAAGGAALGLLGGGAAAAATPASADAACPPGAALQQRHAFHGPHQAGVTTPRQATGLVASFDVLATDRADLARLFRTLTERIAFLMSGGPAPSLDPRFPPPDSGLLGPEIVPDGLTVTVAVGASLFDGRFGLAAARPRHLVAMPRFPNDALGSAECHGDLAIQICSNTAETNIHALRDIVKNTPDLLYLRWKQDGSVPAQQAEVEGGSARNFLGFRDGTANPDPTDAALMDRVVWVQPASGEPDWAAGGSYQVIRIIRNFVERWDRTPLREQEKIIGRHKMTGAPLTRTAEFDLPDYDSDPAGEVTPLDAHIRLANPRTAESSRNLILRRPFNYARGVTRSGQLDMGLLFICFQADLEAGFATVQQRLNGEPLEEYIQPVGGGYFFVLPGVTDPAGYLGQPLLDATQSA